MNFYKNGNYLVCIMNDGTKIRKTEDDEFIPAFAENCDVKVTDKCSIKCPFCFPAGTLITIKGETDAFVQKAIEDIKVGDMAWSYNQNFNGDEYACVTQLFAREYDGDLIEFRIGASVLTCTPNHKIFVKYKNDVNGSWIAAEDIEFGDAYDPSVRSVGGWTRISSMSVIQNFHGTVYNIGVEHNHNYYAGNGHILVHNCYEGCTPEGQHADFFNEKFKNMLDSLHPYTEMAMNGNDLDHPDFEKFLMLLKEKKVFANITVQQKQFINNFDTIKRWAEEKLIYGIGVSLSSVTEELLNCLKEFPNAVVHTINGILTPNDVVSLKDHNIKMLILGYKDLQRGISYKAYHNESIQANQKWLYDNLGEMIKDGWMKVISFDNLAIEQLEVKRLLDDKKWEEFYMGDDGHYTFYIDMVKGEFAKNSLSQVRYPIDGQTIDEMFQTILKNN